MHSIPVSLPADLPVAFLAKATVLLVAALLATAALRRAPAGARHLVWLGSLVAVLALPALSRLLPLRLEVVPGPLAALVPGASSAGAGTGSAADCRPRTTCAVSESDPTLGAPPPKSTIAPTGASRDIAPSRNASNYPSEFRSAQAAVGSAQPVVRSLQSAVGDGRAIAWALIGLWAAVALGLIGWLGAGALTVRRIIGGARTLDGPAWMAPLYEVADRLDLREAPRLLTSARVEMPFACGVLRPTIILPAAAESWSDDRRRAVLFHELAHVRRRDLIGHTLGRVACALYWFHPLVWTAARRLRTESERACDDLVLACGTRASDYADHLLEIVTSGRRVAAPAVVLPMARRTEFEGRMLAILDPDVRRGGPSRAQSGALVAGLAALALSVAALAPARPADGATRRAAPAESAAVTPPAVSRLAESRQAATRDPMTAGASRTPRDTARTMPTAPAGAARRDSAAARAARAEVADVSAARDEADPPETPPETPALAARPDTPVDVRASGPERVAMLLRVLRSDSDPSVRRSAAWALKAMDAEAAADGLLEALRRDADASVREMAAWALAGQSREAVAAVLAAALQRDQSAEVRETAAWALGLAGGRGFIDALDDAVRDTSAEVRATAAWALGQVRPRRAPGALIAALADPEEQVRLTAAWALGQILDPATSPMLLAAFDAEPDDEVRRAELRALAFLGERSQDFLDRALASKDPELRSRATQMLAGRGPGIWPWPWPMPRPRPSP